MKGAAGSGLLKMPAVAAFVDRILRGEVSVEQGREALHLTGVGMKKILNRRRKELGLDGRETTASTADMAAVKLEVMHTRKLVEDLADLIRGLARDLADLKDGGGRGGRRSRMRPDARA